MACMLKGAGRALALVLFMLVRASAEVPFKLSLLLDQGFVLHFMVFVVLLMLARAQSAESPPATIASPPVKGGMNKIGVARGLTT